MELLGALQEYIKPELLIVTPVLYIIAKTMDASSLKKTKIPWILLGIAVALAGLYTFATTKTDTFPHVMMAFFMTFVQGVLLSGTAIYGGILGSSIKNKKEM